MNIKEITVPDLGNFAEVPVIDVLVKAGDLVEIDSPLLTLETDKASMDVPSPVAGTVEAILVARGEKVSKGHLIARIRAEVDTSAAPAPPQSQRLRRLRHRVLLRVLLQAQHLLRRANPRRQPIDIRPSSYSVLAPAVIRPRFERRILACR